MNVTSSTYCSNLRLQHRALYQTVLGDDPCSGGISSTMLRKVLVVDDERDLADLTADLLSAHGLDVLVAYSAFEAIDMLTAGAEIDAVFSDVMMPGMTGLELAGILRTRFPKVKIVLTSGYTANKFQDELDQPYLSIPKPYRIEAVLKILRS